MTRPPSDELAPARRAVPMACAVRESWVRAAVRASVLAVGLCAGLLSTRAHAQSDARGASALSNPRSAALALSTPHFSASDGPATSSHTPRDTAQRLSPSPMGSLGIGLHLGVAGTRAGSATVQGYEGRTDKRTGLHVALPIYVGGEGFGWIFEPMLQRSEVLHSIKDQLGFVTGSEDVEVLGIGAYTGASVQIQAARALYLGIGLGAKFLYLSNDAFDYALDLYGRLPLSATYYVSEPLAFVLELGLGYGISAFADRPRPMLDVATRELRIVSDDPEFGAAFAWDLSLGVRLP